MFLAAFLIGLREGMEASLIIGILVAYMKKVGTSSNVRSIWVGVGAAIGLTLALGALFTFGRYGLSFKAQEILGGSLSLLAVVMITSMAFWMMSAGVRMKTELEKNSRKALATGSAVSIFWIAFVSVGREGMETTLMLWGWLTTPVALAGAVIGIVAAAVVGWVLYSQVVRINYAAFFTWTGAFLIVVAGGILAYGIHDLQEAAVLPGPFSGAPITPTDVRTGEVLTGFTDHPFWLAAFPFGWAFDYSDVLDPTGVVATFLKGTVGFTPQMTWLEVTAWFVYIFTVFPRFIRRSRTHRSGTAKKKKEGEDARKGKVLEDDAQEEGANDTVEHFSPAHSIDSSSSVNRSSFTHAPEEHIR